MPDFMHKRMKAEGAAVQRVVVVEALRAKPCKIEHNVTGTTEIAEIVVGAQGAFTRVFGIGAVDDADIDV